MLLVADFVNLLVIIIVGCVFGTSLGFVEHVHVTSNCGIGIVGEAVEALNVSAEGASLSHTRREDVTTSCTFELILVVSMWLLVKLVDPFSHELIVFQSSLSEVRALIPGHRQRLLVLLTLKNDTEISKPILGSVPVHLVKIGVQASCNCVDLCFLNSI